MNCSHSAFPCWSIVGFTGGAEPLPYKNVVCFYTTFIPINLIFCTLEASVKLQPLRFPSPSPSRLRRATSPIGRGYSVLVCNTHTNINMTIIIHIQDVSWETAGCGHPALLYDKHKFKSHRHSKIIIRQILNY